MQKKRLMMENLDHRRGPAPAAAVAVQQHSKMERVDLFRVIVNFTNGRPATSMETADRAAALSIFRDALERMPCVANVSIGAVLDLPSESQPIPIRELQSFGEEDEDEHDDEKQQQQREQDDEGGSHRGVDGSTAKRELLKEDVDRITNIVKELEAIDADPDNNDPSTFERNSLRSLLIMTLDTYFVEIDMLNHMDLLGEWKTTYNLYRQRPPPRGGRKRATMEEVE